VLGRGSETPDDHMHARTSPHHSHTHTRTLQPHLQTTPFLNYSRNLAHAPFWRRQKVKFEPTWFKGVAQGPSPRPRRPQRQVHEPTHTPLHTHDTGKSAPKPGATINTHDTGKSAPKPGAGKGEREEEPHTRTLMEMGVTEATEFIRQQTLAALQEKNYEMQTILKAQLVQEAARQSALRDNSEKPQARGKKRKREESSSSGDSSSSTSDDDSCSSSDVQEYDPDAEGGDNRDQLDRDWTAQRGSGHLHSIQPIDHKHGPRFASCIWPSPEGLITRLSLFCASSSATLCSVCRSGRHVSARAKDQGQPGNGWEDGKGAQEPPSQAEPSSEAVGHARSHVRGNTLGRGPHTKPAAAAGRKGGLRLETTLCVSSRPKRPRPRVPGAVPQAHIGSLAFAVHSCFIVLPSTNIHSQGTGPSTRLRFGVVASRPRRNW
jgi:hypothetical protein